MPLPGSVSGRVWRAGRIEPMATEMPLSWSLVIPVKVLARAKSRLAVLAGPRRAELALAMAADTVASAVACPVIGAVIVVTDDCAAGAELGGLGAHVVADEPGAGLNPALVFGPGEVYRRTLTVFRLVKYGLLPVVPPGGTTLCDVRDVAQAHVAALTRGEPGARYITGGPQLTFRQLATTIAEVTHGARPIAELPASLLRAAALPVAALHRLGVPLPVSPGNIAYLGNYGYYSSARAEAALGYHTRDAAETLGDAARWYTTQGLL